MFYETVSNKLVVLMIKFILPLMVFERMEMNMMTTLQHVNPSTIMIK